MVIEIFSWSGIVAGLLVSLVLLFFPQSGRSGNQLLGVTFITLTYALITTKLYSSGFIMDFPHLSRTGGLTAFLISPSFYLFTRFIFYRDQYFKKWDWLLLVPSVFYLIDFIPYFLLSAEEKRMYIGGNQLEANHFKFDEGWISGAMFQVYLRPFWSSLFLVLSMRILWINRSVIKYGKTIINSTIFWFISILALCFTVTLIPSFLVLWPNQMWYTLEIQQVTIAITLILVSLTLIFSPKFLYGFFWENEIIKRIITPQKIIQSETIISEETPIFKEIERYVTYSRPYLRQGYSITDLSKDTGIPVYKISPAVNCCSGMNFNQWINYYRIARFEEMTKNNLQESLTLQGIAMSCGFSNRTSFIAAFKKIKGTTPSKYLKDKPIDSKNS